MNFWTNLNCYKTGHDRIENRLRYGGMRDNERPLLIFSHPNPKSMKNRARIRIADSNWSEPISFEAVGAEFEFDCKSMLTSKWYNLGGYVTLGQGKVISIAYYYNQLPVMILTCVVWLDQNHLSC